MTKVLFFGAYDINARIPLVAELRKHGIDVELAGIGASPTPAAATNNGTVIHSISTGGSKRDLTKVPGLLRELRIAIGADLVHTWDSIPGALAMHAARSDRDCVYTRTITGTGQSFSTSGAKGFALRNGYGLAQRLNADEADFTVFQNTDDHQLFVDKGWIPADKAMVIPGSGVKLQTFDEARGTGRGAAMRAQFGIGDRWLVVLASRLLKAKGVSEFCDAARLCDGKLGREAVFLIVGAEEPNARRAAVVTPFKGVEVEVIYGGNCDDMPGLLATSDVVMLPTAYREGIPRILLEAAAAEVPIVASDMPGCRDVVIDNVTGIRVPPRAAQPMADAAIRLAHDATLAKQLTIGARERVEELMTLDIIAGQYADLFHQLIAKKSTGVTPGPRRGTGIPGVKESHS
jgi:glycosyltransferase involved in cell wall biosynthesis